MIKRELSLSKQGPQKLTDIIDGGTFLLSTLDSVLPETTSLLRTSRVVLTLVADKNAGIAVASDNLSPPSTASTDARRLSPVHRSDAGHPHRYRQPVHRQLRHHGATARQPGHHLAAALPAGARAERIVSRYRTSVLDAMGSIMHDNGLWATGDIYPRYACDYGTPRRPPSSADYPEPYLYTYCSNDHPGVLVRGAKNAPRPAGDDTAGPPPARTSAARPIRPQGPVHHSHAIRRPGAADRATPLNTIAEEMT